MKREISNEELIIKVINNLNFVICYYEIRILSYYLVLWISISLNRVEIIDISRIDLEIRSEDCYYKTKMPFMKIIMLHVS